MTKDYLGDAMALSCWADNAHFVGLWAQSADLPLHGPGYYYSLSKIVILLIVYFCWISSCTWVNRDAGEVGLDARLWNGALFAAGLLGLLAVWGLPAFFPGLLLLLLLYGGALAGYVLVRNRKVPAEQRVFTERHVRAVLMRWLKPEKKPPVKEKTKIGGKTRREDDEEAAQDGERTEEAKAPVRFPVRTGQRDDARRVGRAQASKGHRLAVQLLQQAVRRGASELHLEPTGEELAVDFGVNGVLQQGDVFPRVVGETVINTFKILGGLEVGERRKAQEGGFPAEVEGRTLDFRVATTRTALGERLVLAVAEKVRPVGDRSRTTVNLGQLGLSVPMYQQVRALLTGPPGLFVVCGPASSGTTTTLYAALGEIDRSRHPILTIEDPVAAPLAGVTQIAVGGKTGHTFATQLRGILGQPADVIMVGELRDRETAEVACIAGQAGRRIYAGLQAGDALDAVRRLLELKVSPALVASALSGVLAQRLMRALCPQCRVSYKPDADLLRKLGLPVERPRTFFHPPDPEDAEQARGGPCPQCGSSGYLGRTGVFELLVVTDDMRSAIRDRPDLGTLKEEASKAGLRPLREDGLRLVHEGRTSVAELLKVCR
jgi:type II secretory ATPase GspE/PulE/Tfp pilus assembly ATPase PilB-like protein